MVQSPMAFPLVSLPVSVDRPPSNVMDPYPVTGPAKSNVWNSYNDQQEIVCILTSLIG